MVQTMVGMAPTMGGVEMVAGMMDGEAITNRCIIEEAVLREEEGGADLRGEEVEAEDVVEDPLYADISCPRVVANEDAVVVFYIRLVMDLIHYYLTHHDPHDNPLWLCEDNIA